MRDNSFDRTIERNYVQKWRFLIAEYEEVKAGHSQKFARVGEFYQQHGACSQTFRKYYNRYLRSGAEADLLPPRVRPRPLPPDIVRIAPQYREYEYTVVDNRVVIVDPRSRGLVDVLDESGSRASCVSSASAS
jgi:hypothetical protein